MVTGTTSVSRGRQTKETGTCTKMEFLVEKELCLLTSATYQVRTNRVITAVWISTYSCVNVFETVAKTRTQEPSGPPGYKSPASV